MALMAEFKTAYLQREVAIDATLAADLKVGQVCTLSSAGALAAATSVAVGNVIIAQSDMTVGNGHVPVENRDWKYSDVVAASSTKKHVMVFVITDVNDIITKTV